MTATLDTTKLIEIFVKCDDFCKSLATRQLSEHVKSNYHQKHMSDSEIMSIAIFYHLSGFKCFKYYYQHCICHQLKSYFPEAYTYSKFVNKMKACHYPLLTFLATTRLAPATEANVIDATKLVTCHAKRIFSHKVFEGFASRGKSSTGWFFGFKLHTIINHYGELVAFQLTSGRVADNNPDVLRHITKYFEGNLFGDAGYISSIANELKDSGVNLITKIRKNMKEKPRTPEEKHYLKHRGIIESAFHLMKDFCDIEHTRHRSTKNFLINLWSGLTAYTFLDNRPSCPTYVNKMDRKDCLLIV
jgi:hypothetical protein